MAITAAGLAGGAKANNTTSVSRSVGSVTAGQLVIIMGMKYSPGSDVFVAGDCTQTAGTATISTPTLDAIYGGDDGSGTDYNYTGIWSCLVTGSGTLTMQVGGALAGSYLLIGVEAFNPDSGFAWDAARLEDENGGNFQTNSLASTDTGNGTSAGAAVFAACMNLSSSNGAITEDGAFTLIFENHDADDNGSSIYRIVSTGTTDSGTWSHSTSNTGSAAALAVYKQTAAGGGGGATSRNLLLMGVG